MSYTGGVPQSQQGNLRLFGLLTQINTLFVVACSSTCILSLRVKASSVPVYLLYTLSAVLHLCCSYGVWVGDGRGGNKDRCFGPVSDLQCWQGFVALQLKLLSLSTNQDCEIDSATSLCSRRRASSAIYITLTSNNLSCCLEHMVDISTEAFSSSLQVL